MNLTNDALQSFLQRLIQTESFSGEEGPLARMIQKEMHNLGFQNVQIDGMGNVIGQMGDGPKAVLFDGHMDTVRVEDAAVWKMSPFSGAIAAGTIYGRGSVDMKSGLAAAIYAAARAGMVGGKTVYVTATVDEEFCDGAALGYVLDRLSHRPEAVVICEPSDACMIRRQRGKALLEIETYGRAAHGSTPQLGKNAIYEMGALLPKIQKLGERLAASSLAGSLTLSRITSRSNSLNAVPDRCGVCVDRRLAVGESRQTVMTEWNALIAGYAASWRIMDLSRVSWTGCPIVYHPLHDPWELDFAAPLGRLALAAWQKAVSRPPRFSDWQFSTNAVAAVDRKIPVLGFGPGVPEAAHTVDENCSLDQIFLAAEYYKALIELL